MSEGISRIRLERNTSPGEPDRSAGAGSNHFGVLRDGWLWFAALAVSLAVYASELRSFTLSIDEELLGLEPPWKPWMLLGRWAHAAMMMVLPLHEHPRLATLVFCVGLAASGVLFAALLTRDRGRAFAFAALFASCPAWPHIGEFVSFSWGVGIGLLLCAAALHALRLRGVTGIVASGLLLAFPIGIYQTLFSLFVVVALLRWFQAMVERDSREVPRSGEAGGELARAAAGGAIGLVAYSAVTRYFLETDMASRSHIESWLILTGLFTKGSGALERIARRLIALGTGTDPAFVGLGVLVLAASWIGATLILRRLALYSAPSARNRAATALALLAAIGLAFAPVVLSSGYIPIRAMVALPAIYAFLASAIVTGPAVARRTALLLVAATVSANASVTTTLFALDRDARKRDGAVAAQIIERIERLTAPEGPRETGIAVSGYLRLSPDGPPRRVEVFGSSFFEHDRGNVWRVVEYLRLEGLRAVRPVTLSSVPNAFELIERMPDWPEEGSVAIVDGTVVIKFGPPNEAQGIPSRR